MRLTLARTTSLSFRAVLFTLLWSGICFLALPSVSAYGPLGDRIADRLLGQSSFDTGLPGNSAVFDRPYGVTVDKSGRLWVADTEKGYVQSWPDARTFTFTSTADITLTATPIFKPAAVAVDNDGNVYVADRDGNRVLVFDYPVSTSSTPSKVIGQLDFSSVSPNHDGGSTSHQNGLNGPVRLNIDIQNHLYVADMNNNRVLQFELPLASITNTLATRVFGRNSFELAHADICDYASAATLCHPSGVTTDIYGNVYVADTFNNRIVRYNSPFTNGMAASVVIGQANLVDHLPNQGLGLPPSEYTLNQPVSVAFNNIGHLFVADAQNHRVLGYNVPIRNSMPASRLIGQTSFSDATITFQSNSTLAYPYGIAFDPYDNLYVADWNANRVLGYDGPFFSHVLHPYIVKH